MLYIITAIKPEAQAFVDKYKLTKTKYDNFTLYSSDNMRVVLSGVGIDNASIAIKSVVESFAPAKDDIFLNIGICGASKEYKIGEVLEICSIAYRDNSYVLNENSAHKITCVESEVSTDGYEIVDMESFAFYMETKDMNNRYMFKVVSDNFEPNMVTKEETKKLIFNAIEDIMGRVIK